MELIINENLDKRIEQMKEVIRQEIPSFQELGHKFLDKEITSGEFKATSGGMGVYAQRSGDRFMLRLRILSGVLDIKTLTLIHEIVKEYSLEFIHFTTRQTIQLHNLTFDDMIAIMEKCLDYNILARGGGGNYPRNVSLSPLSGVALEEAFDVTPYALLVNKYFLSQINTYHLPRKFKVAFSNSAEDSAKASIADLGFLAVKEGNKEYFKVYLGGSLGSKGELAVPYPKLIKPQEIFYHIEALLSLFQEEGDYENKAKARIRYIVKRMGSELFLDCYEKHLEQVKSSSKLDFEIISDEEIVSDVIEKEEAELNPALVIPQKQGNLYSVEIHPLGGHLKAEALGKILHFIKKIKDVQLRLSMEESMIIRNLTADQAKNLLELTKDIRMTSRLGRSICCIGFPTCQIGIQNGNSLLVNILDYFKDKKLKGDILPRISISGCTNSCARHQVGAIGLQGKKKRVKDQTEDAYALFLGGEVGQEGTRLGEECGDLLAKDIPEFLYELALLLENKKLEFEECFRQEKDEVIELINKYVII